MIVFGIIASIALVPQTKQKELVGKRAFPQHTVYQAGTIKPDNVSQEELDAAVTNFYKAQKMNILSSQLMKMINIIFFTMIKDMQSPRMQ